MRQLNFLSFSATRGGAAIAAFRIYRLVFPHVAQASFFAVERSPVTRAKLPVLYPTRFKALFHRFRWILSHILGRMQPTPSGGKQSLNLWGCPHLRRAISEATCVHVHWINNEALRIQDFPLLSGKSIITLHDEWFYCGSEHYANHEELFARVVQGYRPANCNHTGLDLSRRIWTLKHRTYPKLRDVIFTVPSSWMQGRALSSLLLRGRDIRVVPNPIDTTVFSRRDSRTERRHFPSGVFLIAFGAVGGATNPLKGFDLLEHALQLLRARRPDALIQLLLFGGEQRGATSIAGWAAWQLGHLQDPQELSEVYSSADITVVPSRVESFGQVAAESMSCETPVLAFRTSGLTDVVRHIQNGYLAEPSDAESLAQGLEWFLDLSSDTRRALGRQARQWVQQQFSNDAVRKRFLDLYEEIFARTSTPVQAEP